jgi:DNA mismatch repair protein MutL
MLNIQKLPENLIHKIAAGEVVERPASVVKELIENSLDAKSSYIKVYIETSNGFYSIRVVDNGLGISNENINLLCTLHATSKISNFDDLYKLSSYGFRGEALATISSVCDLIEIRSKTSGENGFIFTKTDGTVKVKEKVNISNTGTEIHIRNLFAKIPARLKFLKTEATELRQITQTFISLALPNQSIHFELYYNENLIHNLPATTNMTNRIADIWGHELAKQLIPVSIDTESYRLKGCVIDPNYTQKSTDKQFISINGRYVIDKAIQSAIQKAFSQYIHKDLKPWYFLDIHIPSSNLDVNVHPRKLEVKYDNPSEIFMLVYRSVEKAISDHLNKKMQSHFTFFKKENDLTIDSKNTRSDKLVGMHNTSANLNKNPSKAKTNAYNLFSNNSSTNYNHVEKNNFLHIAEALIEYKESRLISPFQIFNTYIIYEENDEMIVIDQHAAAEKIQFEKLLSKFYEGTIESVPLLIPEILTLSMPDKLSIIELKADLEKIGISFEDFGNNDLSFTHFPSLSKLFNISAFIDEILDNDIHQKLLSTKIESQCDIPDFIYSAIAIASCHGSIRAGQELSVEEMRSIIIDLEKLNNPHNCPHGRPIYWRVSKNDLSKNFKRII